MRLTPYLTTLLMTFFALFGCKTSNSAISLKGLTVDESSKKIEYTKLFARDTITISQIIAYESSYYRQRNASGANDQGVKAAIKMIKWLKSDARNELFKGRLIVETDTFPKQMHEFTFNNIYRFKARAEGISVRYEGKTKKINANINIVLGSSIDPSYERRMPEEFRSELARAFSEDEIVSYNGHIWTQEEQSQNSPWIAAPVDENTNQLAAAIRDLGGRKRYGIIYMNACHGEKIENTIMDAMIAKPENQTSEPILLSHRNYSNYGFFAAHNASMLVNIFNSRDLSKVILDLTTTINKDWLNRYAVADDPSLTLQRYYNAPGVRDNPNSVVIVAYDVIQRRPTSSELTP